MQKTEKKIIVLPFISNGINNAKCELETILVQGLKYKLFPISNLSIINLSKEETNSNANNEIKDYQPAEIKYFIKKNKAQLALVGKLDTSGENITFKLFDNQESFSQDDPKDEFQFNLKSLNFIINKNAQSIIKKLHIELDHSIKEFIESSSVECVDSYFNLLKSQDNTYTIEEKIEFLEKCMEIDPEFYFSYYEYAKLLKLQQNFLKAIEILQAGIKKSKSKYFSSLICCEIARCYKSLKDDEASLKYWKQAIELYEKNIIAYLQLALTAEHNNNYEESEKYYKIIQDIAPNDERSYIYLARLYSSQNKWENSIQEYHKLRKLKPYDAWTASNIGNCHLHLGEQFEAMNALKLATELDPNGEAGIYASQVLATLKEHKKKVWWKFWKDKKSR